ncbi:AsmA-like C-terminal region [Rhizobium sp. RU35A]|uniref:YhdP family protein n=1 Tax=Rhizobium sp. RU35A TaxID=1907414 RepID=UPI000956419B|nr:DUF3971 domain-containing protein [Rhizobium sp. RU35A]SIR00387.1 AsmA-like C-terminal region [Rhizobium sp. RU35A]
MAEIRGEKVTFRQKDLVALHELPSAQAHDPLIVHCPAPSTRAGTIMRFFLIFLAICGLAAGAGFFAIETGTIDSTLNARAQSALNDAIGPRYRATVGSTVLRFSSDFRLALEARDVNVVEVASGAHLTRTGAVRLAIDPLALASGRVSIRRISAHDISLDTALLPASDPMDLSKTRIDSLPFALEQAFQRLDEARGLIERTGTGLVRLSGIEIRFPPDHTGHVARLMIDDLRLSLTDKGQVALDGVMELEGHRAALSVQSNAINGVTRALAARLSGLDLTPFLLQKDDNGEPREGLQGAIDMDLNATRDTTEADPAIKATIHHTPGTVYFDGVGQELSGAEVSATYDFAKNSIEILPSRLRFGPTVVPVSGAIIDLDRLNPAEKRPGYGLDLLVSGGHAQAASGGEQPTLFDLQASGRYLTAARELQFDSMQVSSPSGQMAGSLKIRFPGKVSPEISFGAQLPRMEVAAVKQLWPFWMARKARDWAVSSLFGGEVTDGSIAVFIPAGRMHGPGIPMELDANELRIAFDIADTRLNLPGDMPPVRNLAGHFDLHGAQLTVAIKDANSYFPSGRSVTATGGTFSIASTYAKPLMADLALDVTGAADALAELSTFKPIDALKDTDFVAKDFRGEAEASVKARFGLIKAHNPPPPQFSASIDLNGVSIGKPLAGRTVADLKGTLDVDGTAARLQANGTIDTVPADIMLVEPFNKAKTADRQLVVKATLSNEQRNKLAPGLSDVVDGPVAAEVTRLDGDRQGIKLDLTKASLSLPVVGWSKGAGIPATATFELTEKDKGADVHKLQLTGDGFGLRGDLRMDDAGLATADFSQMQLSPGDDFALSLKRGKGRIYDVTLSGASADLRPVLAKLRAEGDGPVGDGKSGADGGARVRGKIDRLVGFNDEKLASANVSLFVNNGHLRELDLTGVTGSGQAVVGKTSKADRGETITLTSGDAGAVARFTNLYDHMRGGLLNIRIDNGPDGNWSGFVDLRSFSLVNESRLQSMVSTPVGEDGRSLNSAVKRDIDVSTQKFQRGFARVVYRDRSLSVENGVVRGEEIGATFQGMLRDARGNMDMTGTFMPAYGLNRLFAELPIVGAILGNGRDRGLLGITFKLTGPFAQPKLAINPLSIIAPGVFRQIFEFQ